MGDIIARGMATKNARKTGPYAYNTDIGLRNWRNALAKALATNVLSNAVFIGDSITEGVGSSSYKQTSYFYQVQTALNNKYGDAGTGFVGAYYPSSNWNTPQWTFTGSWTVDPSGYGVCLYSEKTSTNGDSCSISFTGTGFGLVGVQGPAAGSASVSIDGGAAQVLNFNNATVIKAKALEITGLTVGSHTAVITAQLTSGQGLWVIGGYPIKGSGGVRINQMGFYGKIVSSFTQPSPLVAEIDMWSPVLTVIALTANDYYQQTPLATYQTGLTTLVTEAQKYGDVLLASIGLHQANAPGTIRQSQYVETMQQLANQYNCAFLDVFNRWGGDWVAQNNASMFSDTVHPNDNGHRDIARAILKVIDEY